MIPIYLDPARSRVALVGRGPLVVRRLAWLKAAGAEADVWSDEPSDQLAAAAGPRLFARLPTQDEFRDYHAVWIAGLAADAAAELAEAARKAHALVNVEDAPSLSNFHTPALVRRGKLVLAVGTGGASPTVARVARERLEKAFTPQWAHALEEIAAARVKLRAEDASFETLIADARARLGAHGLG